MLAVDTGGMWHEQIHALVDMTIQPAGDGRLCRVCPTAASRRSKAAISTPAYR